MFIDIKCNTCPNLCQYANAFDYNDTPPYDSFMNDLKKNLELEMKLRGWNAYQLEAACERKGQKVPQPTIQRILKGGHKDPRTSTVKKLAIGLGISEAQLRGLEPPAIRPYLPAPNVEPGPDIKGKLPLISWVQAGHWCESVDLYAPGDAETWLPCPVAHGPHAYALRVKGDSMISPYPGGRSYPEGTIIFVDPDRPITNGCRVIAKMPDSEEVTFKEYREDAGKRFLKPLNPQYQMQEIQDDNRLCGVIIGQYIPE